MHKLHSQWDTQPKDKSLLTHINFIRNGWLNSSRAQKRTALSEASQATFYLQNEHLVTAEKLLCIGHASEEAD